MFPLHLRLAECQAVGRNAVRLSDVAPVEEMDGVGADVVHFEGCVPRQFALDRQPSTTEHTD